MGSLLVIGIVVGVIIASIAFGTYSYLEIQPNFITVNSGETVQVGPVQYIVTHVGEHNGDEKTRPEETFLQIEVIAENLGQQPTRISGGQFHLLDETDKKYPAVYGNFSNDDLLTEMLEPNKPVRRLTQFDIPYDQDTQYRIGILPTKPQSSRDIGIICVKNC